MCQNPIPKITKHLLDQDSIKNAQEASKIQLVTFLAGPYIDTNKEPTEDPAKKLRYKLFHELNNSGLTVTLGEYNKLIETTKPLFGEYNNATAAEIRHARKTAGAIVIIPSSPGSFLEFGSFLVNKTICEKMLVLINKKYEKDTSYMNDGAVIQAKFNGASVEFIDYKDHNACYEKVNKFTNGQRHRRILSDLMS